ncbi:MAG: flagellar motor switch protein FliN [Bacillota bacterium]
MPDNFLSQEEIDALLGGKSTPPSTGEEITEPEQQPAAAVGEKTRNLDLILDFPLVLSVRLGEVMKNLEEVRQISPGTVIELNRMISDPVDVFVNGKLIARGEVIVVEENFGIKITHIYNPLERVKRLK